MDRAVRTQAAFYPMERRLLAFLRVMRRLV